MAQLTGNKIKDTYLGLLKTNGSGILTSGFQRITDGSGLGSQLYLSLTQIKFHDAYIFPNADGSADQVLSTDGSGALSWQNALPNIPIGILKGDGTNTITAITDGSVNTFLKTDGSGGYSFSDLGTGTNLKLTQWGENSTLINSLATYETSNRSKLVLNSALQSGTIYIQQGGSTPLWILPPAETGGDYTNRYNDIHSTEQFNIRWARDDASSTALGEVDLISFNSDIRIFDNTGTGLFLNKDGTIALKNKPLNPTLEVDYLSFANGGAATFNSSVTAKTGEFISGSQDGALGSVVRISSTNENEDVRNWGIVNTWDNYGDLTFRVSNAQGGNALLAGTSKMVITSGGNVGIGTNPNSWTSAWTVLQLTTGSLFTTDTTVGTPSGQIGIANNYYYNGTNNIRTYDGYASDYLQFNGNHLFRVAGTDASGTNPSFINALQITSEGNVGIGTTSPGFYGLTFNNIVTISSADASTDYAIIELAGGSAAGGGIQFGNQTVRQAGVFSLNGSDLGFYTNSTNSGAGLTQGMRITSGGVLQANYGISFPTPSPASSGTVVASVLDAYEEGTWTPIINQGGANVTLTHSYGTYTRVGNLLHISFYLYSNTPNSLSGSWVVKGLPYSLKFLNQGGYQNIQFGYNSINGADYSFTESGRGQVNTTSALDVYSSWYNTSFTTASLEVSGSGTLLIA
jgi:hypothetical protein